MKQIIKAFCFIIVLLFISVENVYAIFNCVYEHITVRIDGESISVLSSEGQSGVGEFGINNFKDANGQLTCPSKIYCQSFAITNQVVCSSLAEKNRTEIKLTKKDEVSMDLRCEYDNNGFIDVLTVKDNIISYTCGDNCVGQHSFVLKDFLNESNQRVCPDKIYCNNLKNENGVVTRKCVNHAADDYEKQDKTDGTDDLLLPPITLGKLECDTVFKNADGSYNQFYYLFWNALKIMKYAAIALTLGLSLMDYIKVIASNNKDELKKVTTKCIKRLLIGVVLFFVPTILTFVMEIIGNYTTCNLL